jgi:hypothetical protein
LVHYGETLLDHIFVLLHLLSGSPARGTEEAALLFANRGPSDPRGVNVMSGMVLLLYRYNKTQSMTQSESLIPRYVPVELNRLFLQYLSLVRPFLIIVAKHNEVSDELRSNLKTFLYVKPNGTRISSESLTQKFGDVLFKHLDTDITFAQFRQVST